MIINDDNNNNNNTEATVYVVLFSLLLISPPISKYLPQRHLYILTSLWDTNYHERTKQQALSHFSSATAYEHLNTK
jgi:hypothetical protein